jgi:hypothetical protein
MCLISCLALAMVRPPRREYETQSLLPKGLAATFTHTELTLQSAGGYTLKGSFWELQASAKTCIVYCHPNSSSRMEVVSSRVLETAAELGCSVACVDFTGTGQSEGDSISLGAVSEPQDLTVLLTGEYYDACYSAETTRLFFPSPSTHSLSLSLSLAPQPSSAHTDNVALCSGAEVWEQWPSCNSSRTTRCTQPGWATRLLGLVLRLRVRLRLRLISLPHSWVLC